MNDVDRMRLQRGERAVAKLAQQLDQLAAALRLYQHTTTMELSPVPLAPLFDSVRAENVEFARQKALKLRIRPTRAVLPGSPEITGYSISGILLLLPRERFLIRVRTKPTESAASLASCAVGSRTRRPRFVLKRATNF